MPSRRTAKGLHQWTDFEKHTLLCLLSRNMHISGASLPNVESSTIPSTTTPTRRRPRSRSDRDTPLFTRHAHMDVADALNKALNSGNISADIPQKEISAMIDKLLDEKKAAVKFMERQRVGRLTRSLKRVWERGLRFEGSVEEWEGGRKKEEERLRAERASGKFTQVERDIGGVGVGWGGEGEDEGAAKDETAEAVDAWGGGAWGGGTDTAVGSDNTGQAVDALGPQLAAAGVQAVDAWSRAAAAATSEMQAADVAWSGGSPAVVVPTALANLWGSTVAPRPSILPIVSTDPWGASATDSANIRPHLLSESMDGAASTSVNWGGESPLPADTVPTILSDGWGGSAPALANNAWGGASGSESCGPSTIRESTWGTLLPSQPRGSLSDDWDTSLRSSQELTHPDATISDTRNGQNQASPELTMATTSPFSDQVFSFTSSRSGSIADADAGINTRHLTMIEMEKGIDGEEGVKMDISAEKN